MNVQAKIHQSPIEALNYCKTVANADDLILICGSFYLIEKIL
jgi:folylpolyglutamate synthase/dihydropteroate synthase